MVKRPRVGLSLMPTEDFRQSTEGLFDNGQVEVVEWSFDMFWDTMLVPQWCMEIVDDFSRRGFLLGHGVTLSPFSGGFTQRQQQWLELLRRECLQRQYRQVSEHFGFFEAGPFVDGAPLPVPMTGGSIELGRRSLLALKEVSNLPVGLENLALAFCMDDVRNQGEFLDRVLSAVDGFLILDLHNLYCQAVNFNVPVLELFNSYPLERVQELHISGGSWSTRRSDPERPVRRDTHDGPVPEPVFELLESALPLCPNLEYVIFERLGGTMPDSDDQVGISLDYCRMTRLVDGKAD